MKMPTLYEMMRQASKARKDQDWGNAGSGYILIAAAILVLATVINGTDEES